MRTTLLLALALGALAAGCGKKTTAPAGAPLAPRTFRMGFSGVPPRADEAQLIASIQMWALRADAALIVSEPPWDSLLAGVAPDSLVMRNTLPLAQFYGALGLAVVASVDLTNGLDRSSDSAPLVARGRSLTEPAIQQLARRYAVALDTLLHPVALGLASETNLVRAAAPAALHAALVQTANDAAADVRAHDTAVKLFFTVQVETAWGRLPPTGTYQGIAADRADFPFADQLGLSSYPYLGGFAEPEELPLDYYAKLVEGAPLPVLVIEGGWTSADVPGVTSSPDEQRRYVLRQAQLLDRAQAAALFQITFTDLDLTSWDPGGTTILSYFASLGMVDVNLAPKPALAAWDGVYARPRAGGALSVAGLR